MGLLSNTAPWDLDTYGNNKKTLRVLIECEKGSVHKYEYDDKLDKMVIVRDLNPKYKYIYNYGCIPQTLAEDGDNLDAIVISDEPIKSGTIINVLPIMIVNMKDNGDRDDKVVCVPYYGHGHISVRKLINYLRNYKYPHNEGTEIIDIGDKEKALQEISESMNRFSKGRKI